MSEEAVIQHGKNAVACVPTSIRSLHPAFHNQGISDTDYLAELRQKAVDATARKSVQEGRKKVVTRYKVVDFKHRPIPRSFSADGGEAKHAITVQVVDTRASPGASTSTQGDCLEGFAKLDTDCLITFYAVVSLAAWHSGCWSGTLADIAKSRGWKSSTMDSRSRPNAQTKRERLKEHLSLLSSLEFVFQVSKKAKGTNRPVASPLLVTVNSTANGSLGTRGKRSFDICPPMWETMKKEGKILYYEKAVLAASPRTQEWHFRLLMYMTFRWGVNWVTKGLHKNEGKHTERFGVLLRGADVPYENQLRKQGEPWLQTRFEKVMNELANWTPETLIGGYSIEWGEKNVLESRVTFWPTDAVAFAFTKARSKSIQRRESGRARKRKSKRNKS